MDENNKNKTLEPITFFSWLNKDDEFNKKYELVELVHENKDTKEKMYNYICKEKGKELFT